jgi:protein-S-isoprenylcysteine O-methyltransferase Ste14
LAEAAVSNVYRSHNASSWAIASPTRWGPVRLRIIAAATSNLAGAAFAVCLLRPNLRFFLDTHAPMALVFVVQQSWVGVIFLIRRAPRSASHHPFDWAIAYGGWFFGLLVRPGAPALPFASTFGLAMQCADLALWTWAFANLSRSYGIVAADRGLATRGPYNLVRHPLYLAYMIGGVGYLVQSVSLWNTTIIGVTASFQLARILREEQHLDGAAYDQYRRRVRWHLLPGIW